MTETEPKDLLARIDALEDAVVMLGEHLFRERITCPEKVTDAVLLSNHWVEHPDGGLVPSPE